ncbi:MAG: DNA-3-methyladenine glycosylase [Candidatus Bathyarchaeia archaeon]|jgi:DNA-3-methyladenine glycosylase II
MPMPFPNINERRTFQLGAKHVSKVDPKIQQLVKELGQIDFEAGGDPFESLVEAIISQQLNGKSARAIFGRLKALIGSEVIEAHALKRMRVSRLRKAGVSPQKVHYLKDLSSRVANGQLDLERLKKMEDAEVIRILDEVKGIGPWTAHMFLLFTLGRSDVLPVDDLGIQLAVKTVYSLRKLPSAKKIEEIASNWHPYCSVASLYLWHAKNVQ